MGTADPRRWAKGKDRALELMVRAIGPMSARARDVCLVGVPVAGLLGFAANGNRFNTTGWRVGDAAERAEAIRKGRRPFVKGDPYDPTSYGHIGSDDLHELSFYGVEGGHCPTPCATDPECAWVVGARSETVEKILGRAGVEGADWYGADDDAAAIGVWNLARHLGKVREELPEGLGWDEGDTKPLTLWRYALAMMRWSAGGRAAQHCERYKDALLAVPEAQRFGVFLREAATYQGDGVRHQRPSHTGLRSAQKIEAARRAAKLTGEGDAALVWLEDNLGAERDGIYEALVRSAEGRR